MPLSIEGSASVQHNYKGICPLRNLSKRPICIFPSDVDIFGLNQLNRQIIVPIAECIDYKVTETVGSFTGAMVPINNLSQSKMKIKKNFILFLGQHIFFSRNEGALNVPQM